MRQRVQRGAASELDLLLIRVERNEAIIDRLLPRSVRTLIIAFAICGDRQQTSSSSNNTALTSINTVEQSQSCPLQDCEYPWLELQWAVPNQNYQLVGSGLLVQEAFERAYRSEIAYFANVSFDRVIIENITESQKTYATAETPTAVSPSPSPVGSQNSSGTGGPAPSPSTKEKEQVSVRYSVNVTARLLVGCQAGAKKLRFEDLSAAVGYYMQQAIKLELLLRSMSAHPQDRTCAKHRKR